MSRNKCCYGVSVFDWIFRKISTTFVSPNKFIMYYMTRTSSIKYNPRRGGGPVWASNSSTPWHNPELIHTKQCSRTENRRARTRGTPRDHFTSLRRTRKNKGLSKALSSSAAISCSLSNHQKVPNSLETGDVYTRNNPSS